MKRTLFPGETVLYDSDPAVTVPVEDTAEAMASAFFDHLAERFDVARAERAFRAVVAGQKPRKAGRRRRPEEGQFDALLMREHRKLIAAGLSDAKAAAGVAEMFGGASDPFRKSRTVPTIKRRLRELRSR